MRIYFDTSALNRPFDDQSDDRVRLEAEAVAILFAQVESGNAEFVASDYLDFEVSQNPDLEKADRLRTIVDGARLHVSIDPAIVARALRLERLGFRGLDALHVAAAESGGADILVTTDDRMIRRARRGQVTLKLRVVDPIDAARMIRGQR
jgi:predicted nucleic acid-binding protein